MPAVDLDSSALKAEVVRNPKYAQIDPLLVDRIVAEEHDRHQKMSLAVKACRTRLHQLVGAYYDKPNIYAKLTELLKSYPLNSIEERKAFAIEAMPLHASTKERLASIEAFYSTVFAELDPVHSVLDLGCGLNPLCLPFMPLAENFKYKALDVVLPMIGFLNAYFDKSSVDGHAEVFDLSAATPSDEVDLAILLKLLPLLDQTDKALSATLLKQLKAKYLLVSFPLKSLGGSGKGMLATYQRRFGQITEELNAEIKEFRFQNELVYLIKRQANA